jgi:hypothetical protein
LEYLILKPKAGLVIRFPASARLLKVEGERVEKSLFWLRRIKEGDVEICVPAPVAPIENLVEKKVKITEEKK